MRSRWRISTSSLSSWLNKGLKSISKLNEEHSSSVYAMINNRLNQPVSWILTHPDYALTPEEEQSLENDISRLLSGEPLPYITGNRSFYGFDFMVTPDVLIPRPETELLVEEAIKFLSSLNKLSEAADVGTGSGCIAISLAAHLPNVKILATDICFNALQVAKQNSKQHCVNNRINLINANLLDGIENKFDLICANLPYIPTKTLNNLSVLKFEPRLALDGGNGGLKLITRLLSSINNKIKPNGKVLIEIEATQKALFMDYCHFFFPSDSCIIKKDLAGHPRLAIIDIKE